MYRNKRSILLSLSLMAAWLVTTANAQDELTVLETHDVQCLVSADTLTNWEDACEIPLYNPADHSGSQLDSVMFTLTGTATSQVDVTASTAATLNPSSVPPTISTPAGLAGATVSAAWTINGTSLTLDAFPQSAIVGSQNVAIAADTMTTLSDLSGTDEAMLTISGAANTTNYVDDSASGDGTFSVGLTGVGFSQQPFSTGGNLTLSQMTDAGAQLTVQYKTLEALPEPSAGLLASFAFIGVLGLRRRR